MRAWLLTSTVTPGNTAPVVSLTTPEMDAVSCPLAVAAVSSIARAIRPRPPVARRRTMKTSCKTRRAGIERELLIERQRHEFRGGADRADRHDDVLTVVDHVTH